MHYVRCCYLLLLNQVLKLVIAYVYIFISLFQKTLLENLSKFREINVFIQKNRASFSYHIRLFLK